MELTIYTPQDPKALPEITWNYDEIKAFAVEKGNEYKSIAYTENDEAAMKKDRADLNRFINALEDERKKKKAEYMAPYTIFEDQVKDALKPLREAVEVITKGLSEIDRKYRDDKTEKMKGYYAEYFSGLSGLIPFEKTIKEEYYKKAIKDKQLEKAYEDLAARIAGDMEAIDALDEKFRDKAALEYVKRLSLSDALQEAKRLEETEKAIEERRRQQEELRKQQEERRRQEEAARAAGTKKEEAPEQPEKATEPAIQLMTIAFKVTGTREQLLELASWMKSKGLQFGKVE